MTVVDLECRVPTWRVAIRAENGAVHVPLEALKHHEARRAQEKLLLGQGYQDYGRVFCLPDGTPLEPRNFTRHFDWLLKQAGVLYIRFHDTRHTLPRFCSSLGSRRKPFRRCSGTAGLP
jgi:integrase